MRSINGTATHVEEAYKLHGIARGSRMRWLPELLCCRRGVPYQVREGDLQDIHLINATVIRSWHAFAVALLRICLRILY